MEKIRLDKFIADYANITRSESKKAIYKGLATVDGQVVKQIDYKVNLSNTVTLNGQEILAEEYIYIMLNKPKGVVCAAEDKTKQTVIDLIPEGLKRKNLFPVGRLDINTTGLLIITNNGEFAHKVISPKSNIKKVYNVALDGALTQEDKQKIENGIILADGTKCLPCKIEYITPENVNITITEGKYHQVKRMFGVVNLGVNELKRLSIGSIKLDNTLNLGECRRLSAEEIEKICI